MKIQSRSVLMGGDLLGSLNLGGSRRVLSGATYLERLNCAGLVGANIPNGLN